ncbi:J domain-containing protein [Halorarius halobius]|uniref:J domain-containing protein n=1 Tax=Halorarius halobius TaxID=2962671 RepID=UPI0020CDB928|nr:J domain-containing protein [Halorarius halobius]
MNRGWLLFGASALLSAVAVLVGVFALSFPPLFAVALALAGGGYACWTRARERIVADVYTRVGVEPNDDGTVGTEGARIDREATGRVTHEPRDDWDDPDDWPFDDPFWTEGGDPGGSDAADGFDPTDGPGGTTAGRERRTRDRGGATAAGSHAGGNVQFVAPRETEAREVLGVDRDASPEEIRAAYREQVKDAHPDHGGSEEAFKRVRWAYEYLREHHAGEADAGKSA